MNQQHPPLNPKWNPIAFVLVCSIASIGVVCLLLLLERSGVIRATNECLVVLMIPVFYAAFHYPRWVYLLSTWIQLSIALFFVNCVDRDLYYSLVTITALLLMSLVACELIFSSSQRRRDMERALLESENLYAKAIDALGGSPYYLNLWSDEYRLIGDGFKRLVGYDAATVNRKWISNHAKQVILLGELEHLTYERALLKFCSEQGTHWQAQYEIQNPDGTSRWILDSAVQVCDKTGQKIIGAFGVFLDITPYQNSNPSSVVRECTEA